MLELTELPESRATSTAELHDDVGHLLSVTKSLLDSVSKEEKESEISVLAAMRNWQFALLL